MSGYSTIEEGVRASVAAAVPVSEGLRDSALDAFVAVVALAQCSLRRALREHSVVPRISASPAPPAGSTARDILADMERNVRTVFDGGIGEAKSIGQMLDDAGIVRLTADLVARGASYDEVNAMHDIGSKAIRLLGERCSQLREAHVRAVLERDVPDVPARPNVGNVMKWALCVHLDGTPQRAEAVRRRLQALAAYGAVWSILLEDDLTTIVDEGRPLAPALCKRLSIDGARVRALNRFSSLSKALTSYSDMSKTVGHLVLHEAELSVWQSDLENPAWNGYPTTTLPPPFLHKDQHTRDALSAMEADLLRPMAGARAKALGLEGDHRVANFVRSLEARAEHAPLEARQAYLRALRTAVIGTRGVKSFHEGVAIWHRRAACAAALRHENRTDDGGWPALCDTWTSECGRYRIEALTTAAALVEEGNELDHCVGGYYDQCRTGRTHILSLARDGVRMATIEMTVRLADRSFLVSAGQFEGRRNTPPPGDVTDAYRTFLSDVLSGRHRTHKKKVAEFIATREEENRYVAPVTLPLDHARSAWPLYRVMLPRPSAESFDDWVSKTGLDAAFDDILKALTSAAGKPSKPAIMQGVDDNTVEAIIAALPPTLRNMFGLPNAA